MNKSNSKKKNKSEYPDNPWGFLAFCINTLYNILTLKKISMAVVFTVLTINLIFAIKTPFQDYIKPIYDLNIHLISLFNTSLYTIIITIMCIVSIIGNFIQKHYYEKEIHRLTKLRKELIHGISEGDYQTLELDNSSDIDELKKKSKEIFNDKYNNKKK